MATKFNKFSGKGRVGAAKQAYRNSPLGSNRNAAAGKKMWKAVIDKNMRNISRPFGRVKKV